MSYQLRLTDLDHPGHAAEGEDLDLLKAAIPLVDGFVEATRIFERIDRRYFSDGLIDKVMVFKYVGRSYDEDDTHWWVIVGDLPPFIGRTKEGETALSALEWYAELFEKIAEQPDDEYPVEELPPLCMAYSARRQELTPEIRDLIHRRVRMIREIVIPWMLEGE